MKKITVLITLLVLSLVLSGCAKVEYNLVVTKDDVSMNGTAGFSKEVLAQMEEMGEPVEGEEPEDDIEEMSNEFEESGFTTEEYEDDVYKGVKFAKSYGTLEEVSTKEEIEYTDLEDKEDTKLFVIDDSDPTKIKYTAKLKVSNPADELQPVEGGDLTPVKINDQELSLKAQEGDDADTDDTDDTDGLEELIASMDLKFRVSLPVAPLSSNATSVEGNVLTWDLTQFEEEYIEFSFELPKEEETAPLTPTENNEEVENKPLAIVEGANQTYYKGTNGTITLKLNGDLSKLRGIEIDNGNPIKAEDYTVDEESATITFKSSFLENSSLGEHTLTIKYEDEEVETKLTVAENKAAATTEEEKVTTGDKEMTNPKTGDNVLIYVIAAILSVFVFTGSIVYIKKNNM